MDEIKKNDRWNNCRGESLLLRYFDEILLVSRVNYAWFKFAKKKKKRKIKERKKKKKRQNIDS